MANKIAKAYFEFPSPWWDNISSHAKDLISRLLEKDPRNRMTADQMLEHEWIVNPTTSNIIDMDFPGSLSVHKSDQDLLYTINKSIEYRRQLEAQELDDQLKQKSWYTV